VNLEVTVPDVPELNFKPATPAIRNRVKRGNVVKIAGKRGPQMITQANYRKGVRVVPYDGKIDSRPLHRSKGRYDTPNPGTWVAVEKITHYASNRSA
jgi:hypothetical protein